MKAEKATNIPLENVELKDLLKNQWQMPHRGVFGIRQISLFFLCVKKYMKIRLISLKVSELGKGIIKTGQPYPGRPDFLATIFYIKELHILQQGSQLQPSR